MRAIQQTQFGGPEVLELVDLPMPEPGEREVLIRVSRAGMNFADTHQRSNDYLAAQQLPLIPGGEVAGVREDTGQRVVALSGTGGYAEYATAPEALTYPIPDVRYRCHAVRPCMSRASAVPSSTPSGIG